jgi:FG-GAP repeat
VLNLSACSDSGGGPAPAPVRTALTLALSYGIKQFEFSWTAASSGVQEVNQDNDVATTNSGAVYVFRRDSAQVWVQQAYVKASSTGKDDAFGVSIDLADDGNTLAVGAFPR